MSRLYALLVVDIPNIAFDKRQRFNSELIDAGWDQHTTPQVWTKTFYPDLADAKSDAPDEFDDEFIQQHYAVAASETDVRQIAESDVRNAAAKHDVWTWRAFLQIGAVQTEVFES